MLETLRKMMLIGLGAAAMSKDKVKQVIDEVVARGEVSSEEGKKLYDEWMTKAEEQGRNLNESIRRQIRQMLKELGVADRAEISRLEKRLEDLEARLAAVSAQLPETAESEGIPTAE